MNSRRGTSLQTEHFRVVDCDGHQLHMSPAARENARRWFRYPDQHYIQENTSNGAISRVRQMIRDGTSGPFTVAIYAQHKPHCPCNWHRLSGWVEPLEPGHSSVFRTDQVEFCCGRICAPHEVDSVRYEWDEGNPTGRPGCPVRPAT